MMTSEDWIVATNGLVALTSILVAAATEHEAIAAMRDTVVSVIKTLANHPKLTEKIEKEEGDERRNDA